MHLFTLSSYFLTIAHYERVFREGTCAENSQIRAYIYYIVLWAIHCHSQLGINHNSPSEELRLDSASLRSSSLLTFDSLSLHTGGEKCLLLFLNMLWLKQVKEWEENSAYERSCWWEMGQKRSESWMTTMLRSSWHHLQQQLCTLKRVHPERRYELMNTAAHDTGEPQDQSWSWILLRVF